MFQRGALTASIPIFLSLGLQAIAYQHVRSTTRADRRYQILQPPVVKRVEPEYPAAAKSARVSGRVVVEVTIDESGNVVNATAIWGHPLLRDAAIQAARGWRFAPTMVAGLPTKVVSAITFKIGLAQSKARRRRQQACSLTAQEENGHREANDQSCDAELLMHSSRR